ncbi:hypothetical protein M758_3G196600 [Ceratodon purpureus]|nr:hypothetical protein M758_3G196600 [Ceratodon purpureus]
MVAKLQVPSDYGQWRAMAGLVLIAVLMSWMSAADAQDATAPAGDASVVDIVPNEGNPCTIGWFKLHGWLMWGAFAVCFPFGVFVARFGQNYLSQWLNAHIFFQVSGVVLATTGFAIAAIKFPVTVWDNTHVKLGMAIMCLVWLQPLLTNIRPHRGTAMRPAWFVLHWLIGTAAIILGWFDIFKGLDLYVASWPSGGERKLSYVLWACNLAFLAFLYLFFDRLPYIRAQAKDNSLINPRSMPSYNEVNASDVETPFHKTELPVVDNEPRQWSPV